MDGRQKNMLLGLGLFFTWFVIGVLILQSQLGEELLAFFAAAKLSIFCVTGIFAFLGINYGYFEIKEMRNRGPAKITEINKTILANKKGGTHVPPFNIHLSVLRYGFTAVTRALNRRGSRIGMKFRDNSIPGAALSCTEMWVNPAAAIAPT